MVLLTIVFFLLTLFVNEWLFSRLEQVRGINWIYLPAGVRLLCTLLFAEAGALGLLIVSWLVCFFYFFPDEWGRSLYGGLAAALAPYAAFCAARRKLGLASSLRQLTPQRLLWLSALYAVTNALLHQGWPLLTGEGVSLQGGFAMMLGDFNGTLIVLYVCKLLLMIPGKVNRYELR